jgi:hypothetical protein
MPSRLLLLLVPLLLLGGCGFLDPVCPADFGVEVVPREQTLREGESFSVRAFALTCGGRNRAPYPAAWTSSDDGVARVDPTGRVTAVAPGTTDVVATEPGLPPGAGWGSVRVTVIPR